jgi:hypothetical protein
MVWRSSWVVVWAFQSAGRSCAKLFIAASSAGLGACARSRWKRSYSAVSCACSADAPYGSYAARNPSNEHAKTCVTSILRSAHQSMMGSLGDGVANHDGEPLVHTSSLFISMTEDGRCYGGVDPRVEFGDS